MNFTYKAETAFLNLQAALNDKLPANFVISGLPTELEPEEAEESTYRDLLNSTMSDLKTALGYRNEAAVQEHMTILHMHMMLEELHAYPDVLAAFRTFREELTKEPASLLEPDELTDGIPLGRRELLGVGAAIGVPAASGLIFAAGYNVSAESTKETIATKQRLFAKHFMNSLQDFQMRHLEMLLDKRATLPKGSGIDLFSDIDSLFALPEALGKMLPGIEEKLPEYERDAMWKLRNTMQRAVAEGAGSLVLALAKAHPKYLTTTMFGEGNGFTLISYLKSNKYAPRGGADVPIDTLMAELKKIPPPAFWRVDAKGI